MKLSIHVAAAALLLSTTVLAEDQPDFNFGLWETTTTMTMESAQFSLPPQTTSTTECVTEADFDEGRAFMKDMDGCTMISEDLRSDGADYSMVCSQAEAGEINMNMSMEFNGDSMSGVIISEMNGPMGAMNMQIDLAGQRLGDCE